MAWSRRFRGEDCGRSGMDANDERSAVSIAVS